MHGGRSVNSPLACGDAARFQHSLRHAADKEFTPPLPNTPSAHLPTPLH